ncbi:MAG TPA: hypothetical protein VJC07_04010 [Candidatus Nanoarchaeia archaeon]|nr:hypothetical protein [Candidatus Nanoarchaeia archaeon]
MERDTLITILLVGLVILAGAQAIEISGVKSSVGGEISLSDYEGTSLSQDQQTTRYSAPQASAPSMVGGC